MTTNSQIPRLWAERPGLSSLRERRYLAELSLGRWLVCVREQGELRLLDPRTDLAPGLVGWFAWGPAARPARRRLALAMLADALRDDFDGDELALRLCEAFELGGLADQPAAGFSIGAWAIRRWAADALGVSYAAAARKLAAARQTA